MGVRAAVNLNYVIRAISDLQSGSKYLAKNRKMKQNWTRPENFDIPWSVIFDH